MNSALSRAGAGMSGEKASLITEYKSPEQSDETGVVVIGRNEGERLIACLKSVTGATRRVVYVDSGSTDGSPEAAAALGADVIRLDMSTPFTAARARNAGFRHLQETGAPRFVQFVDGDCVVAEGWIEKATRFLGETPEAAIASGRVREKHPERSLYNALADREWAAAPGETEICGGIALVRAEAFISAGEFREGLIAGEEPELCVRLRAKGWRIFRLDEEMARHDIDMTSLGQWLKRARRAGHAFAEVSHLHRGEPEQIWARETIRPLFWTALFLATLFGGAFIHTAIFLLGSAFPLQIARIALRDRPPTAQSWAYASLTMLQKPWEAAGAVQYWAGRFGGGRSKLIEYKSSSTAE